MNIGNSLNQIRENSNLNLYNNLNYQTERIDKKIIIIDSAFCNCYDTSIDGDKDEMGNFVPGGNIGKLTKECINFDTSLNDNVIIDKDCEIYINSIYALNQHGVIDNGLIPDDIYLDIKTLNTKIESNNNFIYKSLIINNENKDDNYIITSNPINIKDIEFSLYKIKNGKKIGIFSN